MSLQVLTTALPLLETAQFVYGGFGLYQTFKEGNIATGLVGLGLMAFGPPGGDTTKTGGKQPGSDVSGGGVPNDGLASLEGAAKAAGSRSELHSGAGQATLDLNYATIDGVPLAKHGFLVATGPEGQQVGFRAGPAARNGGLGSPASSGGDGLFGNLQSQVADFGPDFLDTNANVVASQRVLVTDQPFSEVVGALRNFSNQVNAAGIRYNPLGANSNAFAHQAVTVLGLPRPPPIVFAPGAGTVLRLP